MTIFTIPVLRKNAAKGNVTLSIPQKRCLESGEVNGQKFTRVQVQVAEDGAVLAEWPQQYSRALLEGRLPPTVYRPFPLYPIANVFKAMAPPPVEFFTQDGIGAHYGFHAARVSILKDFGFLTVDHKEGHREYFRATDVLALAKNPHFQTYLKNVYERNRNA